MADKNIERGEQVKYQGRVAPCFVYDHSVSNPTQTYTGCPDPVAVYNELIERYPDAPTEKIRELALARLEKIKEMHDLTGSYVVAEVVVLEADILSPHTDELQVNGETNDAEHLARPRLATAGK